MLSSLILKCLIEKEPRVVINKGGTMITTTPMSYANAIYEASRPVLRISSIYGKQWLRDVEDNNPRRGPWHQAKYDVLDEGAWSVKGACLYMVRASDGGIRYVGETERLKDRWRLARALDAMTQKEWPERQLFHSQCWERIEAEKKVNPHITYEIRVITAKSLAIITDRLGLPGLANIASTMSEKAFVAFVEKWLRNYRNTSFASWNKK